MKQIQYYFLLGIILLNGIHAFGQAKRTTDIKESDWQPTTGKQGKANGEVVAKMISNEGGVIVSEDGLLMVTIPENSLSSPTEVSIQMIENTNPATFGFSYRLNPHNVSFNKPVVLSFKYEDEILEKIDPAILFISTFEKGKWMAMAGKLNQAEKMVSFETSHFSDWSMGNLIKISPRFQFLGDGETSILEILDYGVSAQKLQEGQALPIQSPKRIDEKMVKSWELFGSGDLMPFKASATYSAPTSTTEPTTDEIVATVDYQKGILLLYAWVRTLRPGVYIEAEGKEYFFPDVTQWNNGYISAQTEQGSFSIKIYGENANSTGQWEWNNNSDHPTTFEFDTAVSSDGVYISYKSYHFPNEHSEQKDSNGKINVFYFGSEDDYVSGRFTITNAGKFKPDDNTVTRKAKIKGYFRIYNWKENKF